MAPFFFDTQPHTLSCAFFSITSLFSEIMLYIACGDGLQAKHTKHTRDAKKNVSERLLRENRLPSVEQQHGFGALFHPPSGGGLWAG